MGRLGRYVAGGLLLATMLVVTRPALADARTEARGHFKKGMEAISNGRYEDGIGELQRAYAILPHPNVLYNIARAYAESGDLENAVVYYKRYVAGDPPDRGEVEQIVASLEARIVRQRAALAAAQSSVVQPSAPVVVAPGAAGGPGANGTGAGTGAAGGPAGAGGAAGAGAGAGAGAETDAGAGGGAASVAGAGAVEGAPGGALSPGAGGTATGPGGETVPVTPPPLTAPRAPTPAAGPSEAELGKARTEDVFAETVVTASKGAQSPLDAPSSTSIITEQDIRLSGITKIPELLRRLAGVDIMETTGAQTEVSIRGNNQRLSNKILVLVDGRSVFVDLLGATFWQSLSIGVEDIQRIEVVRGPGSALYGADAFNGVVNVITKKPGEGDSGVNGGYGSNGATHGSLWATGRREDFAWRASAGYDYLPRWSREVPDGRADLHLATPDQNLSARTTRLDLRGTRRIGKNVVVGLGGGLTQGPLEILGIGPLEDVVLSNFQSSDVTAYVESPHVQARVFYNKFRTNFAVNANQVGQSLLPGRADSNVVEGEVQFTDQFETGRLARNAPIAHDLHVGVDNRFIDVQWTYLDKVRNENHPALFLADAISLGKRFAVVGDYRLDYVPYLEKAVQSPKGTVLFHPSKQSTVRASVATAFRQPTFLESYLQVPVQLPVAGASLDSRGVRTDDSSFKVNAERILSTELGYLNQDSDYVSIDADIFYNRTFDQIKLADNRPVTVGDAAKGLVQPDPQTGLYPVFFGGWENACQRFNTYGAELGARTYPTEGLDVYANYTITAVKQDESGCTAAQTAASVKDERTSAHKINAGVQVRTKPGVDGSIDFHYVSPQTWSEQVVDLAQQRIRAEAFHLDAYSLVNARLGYRFLKDQAEASVMAFNLLGSEHREHPFGQKIGRRVMGFLTYRF